ncbi:two-component system histidine kinase PnpS [Selenihalanaerobacter shriftii]|uniref:histidine kinase n=1 Tax=Selenihalanaerobacter shriftii TaxID=142842 RepID=A0A1T4JKT2_9FIRM|nr:ATP-binding protein [Selenihalanaerobacter shriftii]SJZ30751.1 two-component system, OmpR family, phosphate regulon sensor histidine kinase PhoR [Selenihalanaerobacter shriftii]
MFKSIRWRVTTLYLILIIAALLMFSLTLKGFLEDYFITQLEDNILKETRLVRSLLKDEIVSNKRVKKIDRLVDEYSNEAEARITIIGSEGKVLGDSEQDPLKMENHLQRHEVQQSIKTGVGKSTRYSETLKINMKYLALPVKHSGNIVGVVRLALPLTQVKEALADIFSRVINAGLIAIIISLILGLSLTKRITKPIERMTEVAGEMAQGHLDQRLMVTSDDELGRLSYVFNNMADKLKNKINEISDEKNKIEAVLSSMGDGVIAVDNIGKIILFNPSAENFFEVKEEEIIGKYSLEVTRSHKLDQVVMESLEKGEEVSEEIEILYPEERIIRVKATSIKDQDEQIQGVVVVLRDITELRHLEQVRTEFVGNVSHELRTPLTSIKGYVETLLANDNPDSAIYKRFLNVVKDEADRLEQLIIDLLDLSKIESGISGKGYEAINLNQVIEDVLTIVMPKVSDKELNLKIDVPAELAMISGDESQIKRLYINLIDNAVKYTPNCGEVKVKVYEDDEKIWTEISDTGIGIPSEDLPRIFERFYRVDKARSRNLGGTGLGLSIVKHIIEQHNGMIDVESEVEKGTKFIFYFPKVK